MFNPGDELFSGLKAVESNGHTPGHTSCLVGAGKDKLLVWGDIVHFHAVQLPHPEVTIDVDVSPKGAVASRKTILALAADNQWLVAAAHHPFPGLGHVRREAVGYSWAPAEYGPLSTSQPQK